MGRCKPCSTSPALVLLDAVHERILETTHAIASRSLNGGNYPKWGGPGCIKDQLHRGAPTTARKYPPASSLHAQMSLMNDDQDELGLPDRRPHKIRRVEAASTGDLAWPSCDLEIGHVRTTASETQPPRTRGTVACQKCRSRKTKCDNRRPSCGYCLKIGEPCVYEAESNSW